jgi:hypothetical protein
MNVAVRVGEIVRSPASQGPLVVITQALAARLAPVLGLEEVVHHQRQLALDIGRLVEVHAHILDQRHVGRTRPRADVRLVPVSLVGVAIFTAAIRSDVGAAGVRHVSDIERGIRVGVGGDIAWSRVRVIAHVTTIGLFSGIVSARLAALAHTGGKSVNGFTAGHNTPHQRAGGNQWDFGRHRAVTRVSS